MHRAAYKQYEPLDGFAPCLWFLPEGYGDADKGAGVELLLQHQPLGHLRCCLRMRDPDARGAVRSHTIQFLQCTPRALEAIAHVLVDNALDAWPHR